MVKTTSNLTDSSQAIAQKKHWTWAHTFVLLQFSLQIALLFPQFGVLRAPMRIASFALSLVLLVALGAKGPRHPAREAAIWILAILLLSLCLHPSINTLAAGAAQFAIYLAILGPLFWVTRVKMTPKAFENLIFLFWGFHTLSAFFGLLQTYFPGRFQPYLSTAIQSSKFGGDHLLITLASGEQVYRPMGLTDRPGGAAMAGFYALLFAVGIALKLRNPLLKITCMGSAVIGLFCIYLSQVRSVLVLTAICLVCLAAILARTGQVGRLTAMTGTVIALFVGTFTWAVAVGGESTLERITSLFADKPEEIYYQNRGRFLQHTLESLLPQYPLGAGLGRWGTILGYFGNRNDSFASPIWVEIQWTGWLLDGGVPLIIAYVAAIYLACRTAWKIALNQQLGDFALWGGLIFAYNIGVLAITFNYPIFNSQSGMEFWLLNTALFVAARNGMSGNISTKGGKV
jgi:hypothetical protein